MPKAATSRNGKGRRPAQPYPNSALPNLASTDGDQKPAQAIYIRQSGFAFRVTVEPPLEVDFDTLQDTPQAARGYASMVGRLRRLPVLDETGASGV